MHTKVISKIKTMTFQKKKKGEKKMDKLKENNKIKQVLLYKRNKLI